MPEIVLDKKKLKSFIDMESIWGALMIYFCYLSYKNQAPFSMEEVCDELNFDRDYFYSHMVVLTALEIFTHNENKDIFIITGFNDILGELIDEDLIEDKLKTYDETEKNEYFFTDDIKKIEKYFT